jgi:hypothetical protein
MHSCTLVAVSGLTSRTHCSRLTGGREFQCSTEAGCPLRGHRHIPSNEDRPCLVTPPQRKHNGYMVLDRRTHTPLQFRR